MLYSLPGFSADWNPSRLLQSKQAAANCACLLTVDLKALTPVTHLSTFVVRKRFEPTAGSLSTCIMDFWSECWLRHLS